MLRPLRTPSIGRGYIEPQLNIANALPLHMVLIPGGRFFMGSPDNEAQRSDREGPQHQVSVPKFLMGRYPVTQAQWQAVTKLRQIEHELKPNPSRFKGDDLPIESVSWYEAVEFCDRLANHTGRPYRLPSEAEWEYACRAGTTTPFHFGDTISTEVANYKGNYTYNGNYTYGDSSKGEYHNSTIPIGRLNNASAYGLCDMHGNVYEWCQDHWHGNYEGAPTDGSAWIEGGDTGSYVRRGGSWRCPAPDCRSAYRLNDTPEDHYDEIGFRVSCSAPRALQ